MVRITWNEFFLLWLLSKLSLLTLRVYWAITFNSVSTSPTVEKCDFFFFFTFYASAGILLITENTINVNQVMNRYFQLKIDVPICIIQECFRKESMAMVQFSYYILCEANQYVGYQKPLSKIDWLFTPLLSLPVFFPKHCKLIDFLKVCGAGGLEAIDSFFLTERTILKGCRNSFFFEDKKSIPFFQVS